MIGTSQHGTIDIAPLFGASCQDSTDSGPVHRVVVLERGAAFAGEVLDGGTDVTGGALAVPMALVGDERAASVGKTG